MYSCWSRFCTVWLPDALHWIFDGHTRRVSLTTKMTFKSSLVIAFVLVCVSDVCKAGSCSVYAVNQCLQPMLQYDLASTAAIVPTYSEETMRNICDTYEGVRECLTPIHSSCTPDVQALFSGIDQSYYYICDETFDEYVRHRECLSTPMLHSHGDQCSDTLTSDLDSITRQTSPSRRTTLVCIYATDYMRCVRAVVEQYCGPEAASWQEELDIRILGPSLDYIDCPLFEGHLYQWHDPADSSNQNETGASSSNISVGALVGIIVVILLLLFAVAVGLAMYRNRRKRAANEEHGMRSATSSIPPPIGYANGGVTYQPYPGTQSAPPPYKEKEAMYGGDTQYLGEGAPSVYSEPPPYEAVGNPVGGLENEYDDVKNPKFGFENLTYSR